LKFLLQINKANSAQLPQNKPQTYRHLRQYRILKNSHFYLPKSTAKHRLFWHQEEKM